MPRSRKYLPPTTNITPEQQGEYRARVEANEADVEAWYWIGYCPFFGTGGVAQDRKEGKRIWRTTLRDFGYDDDNVQDGTGKIRHALHLYGEAVPRLQLEADQGDSESQMMLADCYENGRGGLQWDSVQAAHWSERSAEQGNVEAQLATARCYKLGTGGERDAVQAAYWMERAAEQGNVYAQGEIAWCYRFGRGVEQDRVKAVEWYDKAIAQGSDHARRYRQALIDDLDETERDRVLGIVQRNKWIKHVKESVELVPPLGLWALALEKLVGTRNKWASLSPTFLCLKEAIPILPEKEADVHYEE